MNQSLPSPLSFAGTMPGIDLGAHKQVPKLSLLIALDLGTTATTAKYGLVRNFLDADGTQCRKIIGHPLDVKDWPSSGDDSSSNSQYLPTELIYSIEDKSLLRWGFWAKDFLDSPPSKPSFDEVLVVEHIKLLLLDPDESAIPSPTSAKHRAMRESIYRILGKDPFQVFEDLLYKILHQVLKTAERFRTKCQNIELVLAFPSGWPEHVHSAVSNVGYRAMNNALATHNIVGLEFSMEHIYTVSETLCGAKEWLQEVIPEATESEDINAERINIEDLNEGDLFLPVDIGGGTGCMTLLQLVSRNPLRVDQIAPTKSLKVSGATVQAEFDQWISRHLSDVREGDFPPNVNVQRIIRRISRKFLDKKRSCGEEGATVWEYEIYGLRRNEEKGFETDYMKIEMSHLEACFDPSIDVLEHEIQTMITDHPNIKMIVFMGQFGGNCKYLRKRMDNSNFATLHEIRFRYGGDNGKLNVVRGAFAHREKPHEKFVRLSQTVRSYGILISLNYLEAEPQELFPDAKENGGIFEYDENGTPWLKVVQWEIPKNTSLESGSTSVNRLRRGLLHHDWPCKTKDPDFEDLMVISDEPLPSPTPKYTLWTEGHTKNQLVIDDQRYNVRTATFSWELSMSHKKGPDGAILGPYSTDELEIAYFPKKIVKGKRRKKRMKLNYDIQLEISEMQLKCYVEAHIGDGPYTKQLAKEQEVELDELKPGGNRSVALKRDLGLMRRLQQFSTGQISPGARESQATENGIIQNVASSQRLINPAADRPRMVQDKHHVGTLPTTSRDPTPKQATVSASRPEYPAESSGRTLSYNREQSEETLFGESFEDQLQTKGPSNTRVQVSRSPESTMPNYSVLTSNLLAPNERESSREMCESCGGEKAICDCRIFDFNVEDWLPASSTTERLQAPHEKRRRLAVLGKRKATEPSDTGPISPIDLTGSPMNISQDKDTSEATPAKTRMAKRGGKHKTFLGTRHQHSKRH